MSGLRTMEGLGGEVSEEGCNWYPVAVPGDPEFCEKPVVQHFTAKVAGRQPVKQRRCADHKLPYEFVEKLEQGLRA